MSVPVLLLAAGLATVGLAVQQPAPGPPRPSSSAPDDRVATLAPPAPVVVEGCVLTARELNGKSTDVGERLGLNEHFVLSSAKLVKGKAPATVTAGPAVYDIAGLTDEQLTLHVGRRVRIDGTFGSLDRTAAPDDGDAPRPELTARTIRQVPGDCALPRS
jgi:hypothetical protein